ncbi:MAG: ABC transporter permease [Acidimicrobiia bacterium]|nr:ABC transporter permease [Acidimicrobiia bacterium]
MIAVVAGAEAAEATSAIDVGWVEMLAAVSLIALAVAISLWRRLGLERSLIEASVRAGVQLLAVGLLFTFIFDAGGARLLAWAWVVIMVLIAMVVVYRRAPSIPGLWPAVLVAVGGSNAVALGLVFGLGVFEHEPVTVVVISGITIGNVLPAAVLAAQQLVRHFAEEQGQVEALLALGFNARDATRFIGPRAARTALVGQIERTRVVGLIALPGAMTGLLLAGVDPIDAVLVQIIVMYLILGAAAVAVTAIVWVGSRQAFTPDMRLADWTRDPERLAAD